MGPLPWRTHLLNIYRGWTFAGGSSVAGFKMGHYLPKQLFFRFYYYYRSV